MRKRKKPTALLTVLVLCVGAVAIMGMPKSNGNPEAPQPQKDENHKATGNDVPTPTKSEIVANVVGKVKDEKKPSAPKPPEMPDGMPKPPPRTGPLALKEKPKAYTPTYNESATSTQWYTDQTPKEVPQTPTPAPAGKPSATPSSK